MKKPLQKKRSLIVMIGTIIAVILCTTLLVCAGIITYSYQVANETTIDAQERSMSIVISEMENELLSSTRILNEIAMDFIANIDDHENENSLNQYFASRRIGALLDTKMSSNFSTDCMFFFSDKNQNHLIRFQSSIPYTEKFSINDYLSEPQTYENDAISGEWHVTKIESKYYLLQFFRIQDGGVGSLVSLSNLLTYVNATHDMRERQAQYLITDQDGIILAQDGQALTQKPHLENFHDVNFDLTQQTLMISMPLVNDFLRLSYVERVDGLLFGTSSTPYFFAALGIISVCVVMVSSFYLRRKIVVPIGNLIEATKKIEGGNLDYIIEDTSDTQEFTALITSFNYMTKQVKNQKIKIYEEEINRQKAELKYLQMQLRPHFYLNAINTISSLSRQSRNIEIEQFIKALSSYLRYLFTDIGTTSTVESEIQHTIDFIKLQQVKYPGLIFYMEDVQDAIRSVAIPKLFIQTFAENIFKHAFDGETMISIFIRAQLIKVDNRSYCQITIEDSGCGFSDAYLQGMQVNDENVGIQNIRQTLALTYNLDNLLQLSNTEQGGACIELKIPVNEDGGEQK